MIIVKIDVKKLNKDYFFVGQKGTYCELLVMENDEPDQYGNTHVVKQGVSKEAREAGEKGKIVGNGKETGRKSAGKAPPPAKPRKPDADPDLDAAADDIPF